MNEEELLNLLEQRYSSGEINFQQYVIEKQQLQNKLLLMQDFDKVMQEPQDRITTIFDSDEYAIGKLPTVKTDELPDLELIDAEKLKKEADANIMGATFEDEKTSLTDSYDKFLPFLNPYGSNMETELFSLGNFIGMEKGTRGKGLGIASAASSALLGGARTFLSGLAQQKQTTKTAEEARKRMQEKVYTPQTNYLNLNNRGGNI